MKTSRTAIGWRYEDQIAANKMTRLAILTAAALITCQAQSVFAQMRNPVAGAWQVSGLGPQPWSAVLDVLGSEVSGSLSSCGSNRGNIVPAQILNGHVDGNTVSFTCSNLDGDELVTFSGTVSGDDLTLAFEQQRRDGRVLPERPADPTGMFGSASPARFVAKRVRSGGKEFGAAVNLVSKRLKIEGALFLPRNVERLRAVFVLINSGTSWNGLAASVYSDPDIRDLARTQDAGLLLLRVTPLDIGAHMYFVNNATAGGDEGLILLLERLGAESGNPELRTAPLLFWGHSAAGPFGTTFALRHPDRTIAFVRYHSGMVGLPKDLGVLQRIPALMLQAGADVANNPEGFAQLEAEWRRGRSSSAPWTSGVEPDAVHQSPVDVKAANVLLIPWITAVLKIRIPVDGGALQPVRGDAVDGNWFPDEASAKGWRTIVKSAK